MRFPIPTLLLGCLLAMPVPAVLAQPSAPAPSTPDTATPDRVGPHIQGPEVPVTETPAPPKETRPLFGNLSRDLDVFTLVNDRPGLSFHKPMYAWPLTYSAEYHGAETEMVFQISLKQRLFGRNLFFGYTQKSFWQIYNTDDSRPFRETNYNPELFYRWKAVWDAAPGLGFDLGIDHQSNGNDVPESRSWNRVIGAVFYETGERLIHLRAWYRIPENAKKHPLDAKGDDNPGIQRYYGYGELRVQQRLFDNGHMASVMLRGNPSTGKGAIELNYSVPVDDYVFWSFNLWHGYGESMIQYDESITRLSIGVALAR